MLSNRENINNPECLKTYLYICCSKVRQLLIKKEDNCIYLTADVGTCFPLSLSIELGWFLHRTHIILLNKSRGVGDYNLMPHYNMLPNHMAVYSVLQEFHAEVGRMVAKQTMFFDWLMIT